MTVQTTGTGEKTVTWLKGCLPGPKMTFKQAASVIGQAGFANEKTEVWITAVALAKAESNHQPQAFLAYIDLYEDTAEQAKTRLRAMGYVVYPAQIIALLESKRWGKLAVMDRGLFQISSRWHAAFSDALAFDEVANARYAYLMWRNWDRSFRAWAAYQNGNYLRHMDAAKSAVLAVIAERDDTEAPPLPPAPPPPPSPKPPPPIQTRPYVFLYGKRWFRSDKARFAHALALRGVKFYWWCKRHPGLALKVFGIRVKEAVKS